MRVLAVEDEAELAYLLKKNLAQRGLVADIAATVAEAEALSLLKTSYGLV